MSVKAATIRDVAARAQVSVASVSRVLTGAEAVTEPTRQRVLEAVAALAYVPHSGARSLSTSRTDTVGVVLPDLFGEFFSELIRGMDIAARACGLHLIVSSSHDDAAEAAAAIRSMRGRVDGLIVLSPHLDAADLAANLTRRLPVLLMNGAANDAGRPSMVVDNSGGATAAVSYLIELGHQRILHISGPSGNLEACDRKAGYLQAMAAAGLEPEVVAGDFTQASGHTAVTQMLRTMSAPQAIFASNDMMAIGALLALQEAGLRCPEDVAVVGFDDVPIASLVRPALSTMRIDIAETGRRAMERLVGLIAASSDPTALQDSACEVVQPRLIVRQSSASTPASQNSRAAPARTSIASNGE